MYAYSEGIDEVLIAIDAICLWEVTAAIRNMFMSFYVQRRIALCFLCDGFLLKVFVSVGKVYEPLIITVIFKGMFYYCF